MEMLEKVRNFLSQLDPQQTMLGASLLLVLLMLMALLLMHKRTKQAEESVREMTKEITEQLAMTDARLQEEKQLSSENTAKPCRR